MGQAIGSNSDTDRDEAMSNWPNSAVFHISFRIYSVSDGTVWGNCDISIREEYGRGKQEYIR